MKRSPHPASSESIAQTAAEWVARRDAGLSSAEAAELAAWAAEPTHAVALKRFSDRWESLTRPRKTGRAHVLREKIEKLGRQRRRRTRVAFFSAATALVLVSAAWWWASREIPPEKTSRAVLLVAQHETLPDGSVVEFPAETDFRVEFTPAVRRIHLNKGEALFTVAKNPERPFIVDAGSIEVRAVGTAFTVRLGQAQIAVMVTEGRVAVDHAGASVSRDMTSAANRPLPETLAMVSAGERVVVDRVLAAAQPVETMPPAEVAERLAWRNPRVEFSGAPLGEVVAMINRHNSVQFVIEDTALKDVPLSGLFRADDSRAFEQMLVSGFGVEAEHRGNEILLRTRGH